MHYKSTRSGHLWYEYWVGSNNELPTTKRGVLWNQWWFHWPVVMLSVLPSYSVGTCIYIQSEFFPPQSRHFKLCSVHEKWLTLSYCHSFWWHRWSQVKTSAAWNRYRIHSEDRSPIANTLQQYDIHNRLFNNLVYFVNTMNSFKFMGPIFYLLLFSKAFWEWNFVIMTRGFNELIIMKKKLCF